MRFALETVALRVVGRDFRGRHLDRNDPVEAHILSTVDLSHASSPDGSDDLVRTETAARG
jgi:hypothetical protein